MPIQSLTSFLPILEPYLGITAAAIYERQRALVRLGLLPQPVGRGRGSGATANPRSAALLMISVLLTDSLSEVDERVGKLFAQPIQTWRKRKRCALTRAERFGDAVVAILANYELATQVTWVAVTRQSLDGYVHWRRKGATHSEVSQFENRYFTTSSILVEARLEGTAFRQTAAVLAAEGRTT